MKLSRTVEYHVDTKDFDVSFVEFLEDLFAA